MGLVTPEVRLDERIRHQAGLGLGHAGLGVGGGGEVE